jgi:hypothetical protein
MVSQKPEEAMQHALERRKGSDKRTHAINLHQPNLLAT